MKSLICPAAIPAILVALLALASCSTDVVATPSPVDIPVSVPCHVPSVTVPVVATVGITAQSTMFQQAQALAAANEQRKAFEAQLVAASQACQ